MQEEKPKYDTFAINSVSYNIHLQYKEVYWLSKSCNNRRKAKQQSVNKTVLLNEKNATLVIKSKKKWMFLLLLNDPARKLKLIKRKSFIHKHLNVSIWI